MIYYFHMTRACAFKATYGPKYIKKRVRIDPSKTSILQSEYDD
jgi:hypothetical protein